MDTNKQFPVLFPADLGFPELSFGNAPLTLNLQGLDGTYGTGFLKEEEGLSQSDKIYPANRYPLRIESLLNQLIVTTRMTREEMTRLLPLRNKIGIRNRINSILARPVDKLSHRLVDGFPPLKITAD